MPAASQSAMVARDGHSTRSASSTTQRSAASKKRTPLRVNIVLSRRQARSCSVATSGTVRGGMA